MKKEKDEVLEEEVTPEVTASKPSLIDADFHREDLNALRDAVNYLLAKGE